MISDLPNEIILKIYSNCDFHTQLSLRQISRRHHGIINDLLRKRQKFDYDQDYITPDETENHDENRPMTSQSSSSMGMDRMIYFVRANMGAVTDFSITAAPFNITLSGLIQLAQAAPLVSSLSVCQRKGVPRVEKDSLYGLHYFKILKSLKLRGWHTVENSRRGCAHRFEPIPVRVLQWLECLSIDCEKDTVVQMLSHLHMNRTKLKNLQKVELSVLLSDPRLPLLLGWFLSNQPKLRSVSLKGVLFTTEQQVSSFYQEIVKMAQLKHIRLLDCRVISPIDPLVNQMFRKSLRDRDCLLEGAVVSLRFDPNDPQPQ